MTAFYNEIEPYPAQWLRNLIVAGHIAPGVVDERSMERVDWRDCDWIPCRYPERGIIYRPVEPGAFPLAHGATARVGRLRAYGNALDAQQAAAFVGAVMESL